ncbi:MAG: Crp/Fnr family transcriptional regulator [Aquabacterium sp.]
MNSLNDRIARRITDSPVFAGMDPFRINHLLLHSRCKYLSRGELLFSPGDPSEGLLLVLDGIFKLYAEDGAGHQKVIDLMGRGHIVPGTQMTSVSHHAHHARSLSRAAILLIPRDVLQAELALDAGLAQRLLEDAARHMRRLMGELEAASLHSARRRACDFLLGQPALAQPASPCEEDPSIVVSLPVSKCTVASFLSITPEHFSRILRELQRDGLIEMQKRTIRILCPQRLAGIS